jgi:CheY-like chemotaxis protein
LGSPQVRHHGCSACVADDPRQWTVCARPDLILLDHNMPDIDGRQTLAAIKTDEFVQAIPVVVLTTWGAAPDTSRCSSTTHLRR